MLGERLNLITLFGLGHMRPAPGTWGSLPPIVLAAGLIAAGAGPGERPLPYYGVLAAMFVVSCAACIAQADRAEARWGKDPSCAVADETAGQCIPLLALPHASIEPAHDAALTLAGAFVAFRVLDIVKPWPARGLQRVPGGWGILLDDLVAGIYAAVVVWGFTWGLTRFAPG